jgi:hypothetical protein
MFVSRDGELFQFFPQTGVCLPIAGPFSFPFPRQAVQ